jgi:hypothetical protein
VTDGLFARCIQDVSSDNTLYFTERQLWYELGRRLMRKTPNIPPPFGWGMAASAGVGVIGAFVLTPLVLIPAIAGMMGIGAWGANVGRKNPVARANPISYSDFQSKYLQRWRAAHGEPAFLLRANTPVNMESGETTGFDTSGLPDVAQYSFDRALVCDADTAQMLVANRFHFENNCAVLSFDRRFPNPQARFDTILQMLRRNPNLFVFALHDASVQGLAQPVRLRQAEWFPDPASAHIVDLGLRPRHIMKTNTPILTGQGGQTVSEFDFGGLTKDEVQWLSTGNIGELAALRPARIMRAAYQGFNKATEVGPDGTLIFVSTGPDVWIMSGGPGYIGDTGAVGGGDIGGVDSFG